MYNTKAMSNICKLENEKHKCEVKVCVFGLRLCLVLYLHISAE